MKNILLKIIYIEIFKVRRVRYSTSLEKDVLRINKNGFEKGIIIQQT